MGKDYQITGQKDSRELAKFLAANGQVMLPMVSLIKECKIAVDDLLEVLGRSTLEAVLSISAAGVAGEAHRGKRGGEIVRHGHQDGVAEFVQSEDAPFPSAASQEGRRCWQRGSDPGV